METEAQQSSFESFLKSKSIYIITALVVTIAFLAFCNYKYAGVTAKREEIDNEYTAGSTLLSQDLLTEEIRETINTYFKEANIDDYISESDRNELVALITTEVLNSLPEDSLTENQQDEVRDMIAAAVGGISNAQNEQIEKVENSVTQVETVITEELRDYISRVIVPNITAMIQINAGEIDDLQKSLASLSNEYVTNKNKYDTLITSIQQQLTKITNDGASQEALDNLRADLNELSAVLTDYKSLNSAQVTDLESELARAGERISALETDLKDLSENQLRELKQTLSQQIANYGELSDAQREELKKAIEALDASSASSLETAKDQLQALIEASSYENTKALQNAINNLYGNADGDTTLEDILSQIANNEELTTSQKTELINIINENYANTSGNIDELRTALSYAVDEQNAKLTSAVDSLKSSLESEVEKLAAVDADLQEQIYAQGRLTDNELAALQASLLEQLEADSTLSEQERQQLADAIANLDSSTASDINAVKNYLLNELGTTNTNITNAVNSLNADLSSIRSTIEANKTAGDAADADLQNKIDSIKNSLGTNNSNTTIYEQITNIQNQLGGWSLEERGGHLWAVMYDDETGAELQAKKLTFAQ